MQRHAKEKGRILSSSFDAYMQEVPTLLSLPQGPVGSPIWLIMTGVTTGIQGYNRLISRIVPLTAAARSVDLIPFMVVISSAIALPIMPSLCQPLSIFVTVRTQVAPAGV